MNFIKENEAQNLSDTRNSLQPVEGVGIVWLGRFEEREVEVRLAVRACCI